MIASLRKDAIFSLPLGFRNTTHTLQDPHRLDQPSDHPPGLLGPRLRLRLASALATKPQVLPMALIETSCSVLACQI